jgi:hypothetical protein
MHDEVAKKLREGKVKLPTISWNEILSLQPIKFHEHHSIHHSIHMKLCICNQHKKKVPICKT